MDRTTRINIGQRAHAYVLHALAHWPTFGAGAPLSEEQAAAALRIPVETLQGLKDGDLKALPELNRLVRRKLGRLSIGEKADVVDYFLPTRLPLEES